MRQFQIGYSQDSWDSLRQELMKRGYHENELAAAGLLVEKEKEGTYDRFRNRLMFPIRDMAGRVVGFGARALDDSLPKYLNSPQTLIFDKSSSLYGIDFARPAIRKENLAVIVEGYMDVVVAHQHGFTNVVASLGTALTDKQVKIIKKLTKCLTLALDADSAGEMATKRGQEVIRHAYDEVTFLPGGTKQGSVVKYEDLYDGDLYSAGWKVALLPHGKDPDEVIKDNPEQWQKLLQEAMPVMDYVFAAVASKLDLSQVQDKSAAVDQLLPAIDAIEDAVARAHYLQKLARMVAVDERTLLTALGRLKQKAPGPRRETKSPPPSKPISHLSSGDSLAEYCLYLLFSYPDLRSHASDLRVDYLLNTEDREIFLAWQNTADVDLLRQELDISLQGHLNALISNATPPLHGDAQERALRECVNRLRVRWLKDLEAKGRILISELEATGNSADLQEIQKSAVKADAELGGLPQWQRKRTKGIRQG
jgi:DNA primase